LTAAAAGANKTFCMMCGLPNSFTTKDPREQVSQIEFGAHYGAGITYEITQTS
jgi:hypothetical protein